MALNITNLTVLRDTIAALDPSRFAMEYWGSYRVPRGLDQNVGATRSELKHDCGTAACIGGWTEALFTKGPEDQRVGQAPDTEVRDALGITPEQANDLFFPFEALSAAGLGDVLYVDLTQAQAVRVLDHLMATGEVDWPLIVSTSK